MIQNTARAFRNSERNILSPLRTPRADEGLGAGWGKFSSTVEQFSTRTGTIVTVGDGIWFLGSGFDPQWPPPGCFAAIFPCGLARKSAADLVL